MRDELAVHYAALREDCGLWRDSSHRVLIVGGEDRVRLLNGLVTCEVEDLAPGQGIRGFFTEIKGHILAEVVVRATADQLWLDLPAAVADAIEDHIQRYIVVDRVEVSKGGDREDLTVLGPRAAELLGPRIGGRDRLPSPPWDHVEVEVAGRPTVLAADEHYGVPAFNLSSLSADAAEVEQDFREWVGEDSIVEVSAAAVEAVRIAAGCPWFGIDYGPEQLPQETGLEDAVSYTKGCYLGQEVVARLHYRGQAVRCLRRLRSAGGTPPPPGSRLTLEDREAGVITSAVCSPVSEEILAIAMLQRRALEAGTKLRLEDGGWMTVVE